MKYQYVSIDRIFSKVIRDIGSDFNEGDVIEWCGEALEFIGAAPYYEEAVAFIEVRDHQCSLPKGLHNIIQIARNNAWTKPDDVFCPKNVIEAITTTTEGEPSIPVAIDCQGMPVNAFDVAFYRPFFDLKFEFQFWMDSTFFQRMFTPVRLKTHSFFNSLVCPESNQGLYTNSMDEYTIIQGKIVRFSFKEGMVAISYTRQVVDEETGYPMIPDNISYTTAITKYITMKMFEKEFYSNREGAQGKMQKAEQDWHWYCKQAGNVDLMPFGVDDHQNLLEQRSYLIPRQNRYYGFFGNMARPEDRRFNDPDFRNNRNYLFRGN